MLSSGALPISAVIATRNRPDQCKDLLASLEQQEKQLQEVIFCDASNDDHTFKLVSARAIHLRARNPGAASQRNEGVAASTQPFVMFMDDDIRLEPGCLGAMWNVMQSQAGIGGVTATIVNEAYVHPGKWTRALLRWFEDGRERASYAGACVGPGMTFWPANDPDAPESLPVDWMGTGCVLYRREVLPSPPFPALFQGAALAEDLCLSLTVGKTAPMLQATRAKFIHLNVGGSHKQHLRVMAAMGLVNRHHILTEVLGKRTVKDQFQFAVMILFSIVGVLVQGRFWDAFLMACGYLQGLLRLTCCRS
jgi:hypothetical protein